MNNKNVDRKPSKNTRDNVIDLKTKMAISKAQLVLILYTDLLSKGVNKENFCNTYHISSPTFKRYISEIRCFLCNIYSYQEVVYFRTSDVYRIVEPSI